MRKSKDKIWRLKMARDEFMRVITEIVSRQRRDRYKKRLSMEKKKSRLVEEAGLMARSRISFAVSKSGM